MTFSTLKLIAQMLLFEIGSFLINSKTENLSFGTFIFFVHTLHFLLLENENVYMLICSSPISIGDVAG